MATISEEELDAINLQNWEKISAKIDKWYIDDLVYSFRHLWGRVVRDSIKNPSENGQAIVRILFTNERFKNHINRNDDVMSYYKNKLMPYWEKVLRDTAVEFDSANEREKIKESGKKADEMEIVIREIEEIAKVMAAAEGIITEPVKAADSEVIESKEQEDTNLVKMEVVGKTDEIEMIIAEAVEETCEAAELIEKEDEKEVTETVVPDCSQTSLKNLTQPTFFNSNSKVQFFNCGNVIAATVAAAAVAAVVVGSMTLSN